MVNFDRRPQAPTIQSKKDRKFPVFYSSCLKYDHGRGVPPVFAFVFEFEFEFIFMFIFILAFMLVLPLVLPPVLPLVFPPTELLFMFPPPPWHLNTPDSNVSAPFRMDIVEPSLIVAVTVSSLMS